MTDALNEMTDEARLKIEADRVKANEATRKAIHEKDNVDFDDDGRLDADSGLEAEAERINAAEDAIDQIAAKDVYVEGETAQDEAESRATLLDPPKATTEEKPAKKTTARKTTARKTTAKKTTARKSTAKKTAAKG